MQWPNKLWVFLLRRFFRLAEVEEFIRRTDERYLDVKSWASIRGISEEEALHQLQFGVQSGWLRQCYLYEWSDSPIAFVVPQEALGQNVRLADVGYIGEDDLREIYISPSRVRKIFITTEKAA
jgi:hypothetical protein